jgi:hypothetical protein
VSTVTNARAVRTDIEAVRRRPADSIDRVPALENDEVTGMTEEKQKQVIRESARREPRDEA